MMKRDSFSDFRSSSDTLRVYKEERLLFSSKKSMLLPLMEYIDKLSDGNRAVVIFDKMVGNAAALLAVKAGCSEVMSPVGSEAAIKTLDYYGIKYHLEKIVSRVKTPAGGNCPMEALSAGKEPEGFYRIMRKMIGDGNRPPD